MAFPGTEIEFELMLAQLAPGLHVATIAGEVDLHNEAELRERLWPLADRQGASVIVDLSGVSFVDSTAIGVFTALAKQLRAGGGRFVIASGDPRIRKVLDVAGLLSFLHLEPSLARAVETIDGASAL
jgi:anti-sigma B factor antagonist